MEYTLTPRGNALNEATCALWLWVEANMDDVRRSREAYDAAAARADVDAD